MYLGSRFKNELLVKAIGVDTSENGLKALEDDSFDCKPVLQGQTADRNTHPLVVGCKEGIRYLGPRICWTLTKPE